MYFCYLIRSRQTVLLIRKRTCCSAAQKLVLILLFWGDISHQPSTIVWNKTACITALYFKCYILLPCISIYLCNKNQPDALFILSLFRQSTSACFGHICSPSSGGVLCMYNKWYVLCFLVDCWPADKQLTGCWQQLVNITHD